MFIVIEGIDGAGKGRQRNELVKYLSDQNLEISTTDFPDHEGKVYTDFIHPALHEEIALSAQAWFLAFVFDQILWQQKINPSVGSKDKYFVADGYFTTTMAYQCKLGKVLTVEQAVEFAETFKLPRPDKVIFVDVDPEIAMERKMQEEGHEEGLDIFERNLGKQKKLRKAFLDLAKDSVWTKWEIVDGNDTIPEVAESIRKVLKFH